MRHIQLTVNGRAYELSIQPWRTLLDVVRNDLKLTGTKEGCNLGDCGACTVIMDGKTINSCLVLAVEADGKEITTIEGLADGDKLHPIQEAFVNHGAIECGFCVPGTVISAKALLDENPDPTEEEIRRAIAGNLCACAGYVKAIEAVGIAAKNIQEEKQRCQNIQL